MRGGDAPGSGGPPAAAGVPAEGSVEGAHPPDLGRQRSRVRRVAAAAARWGLTILVTWFIVKAVGLSLDDLRDLEFSDLRPRWGLLLLSSGTLLLAYLYSASLWGLLVREIGGPVLGLGPSLRVFFTANLGRYLPGKVWQLAGLAYLARREGVSAGTAAGAALLGQGLSLAGACLVGLGVLLSGAEDREVGRGITAAAGLLLLLVLTFPAILRPLVRRLLRRVKGPVPGPLWPDQAFGVRWLGLYTVAWILQGGAFWLLGLSLGMGIPPLLGLSVFPAAYLLGYLAVFAPAGAGVREGFLIAFLTPMLGANGAILALVARVWTTVVELGPALAFAGGYLKRNGGSGQGGERG